jgi:photosystem II stability/assembly factor-like uncharacterized protein
MLRLPNTRQYILLTMMIAAVGFVILFIYSQKTDSPIERRMKKSASGPDQRPSDWDWLRRTFPYWQADRAYFRQQMNRAQEMRYEAVQNKLELVEFAGPTNIGGRISDIEFNPKNPSIVYAGAATGGVFKSTDTGLTWVSVFDNQANLSVGDIGIDPVHPDTLYVGTGEANGGHNNFPGGGVYKSTDGGNSWQFVGLENTASIGRIIVDPSNTQRIFLAAVGSYFLPNPERGIYKSEDGGLTWTQSLFISDSTGAIDIIMDPMNPNRLLVAMWERVRRPNSSHLFGPTSGIYRSLNGGDSWEPLGPGNGLPNPATRIIGRIGLAISQSNPNLVYTLYNDGTYYQGLYKTTDFGTNWTDADPDREINNGAGSFSWYFGQVRIHPTHPDTIFAQDVAFMRSVDGGNNWPLIYGYSGSPSNFHVDHHALAFHPTNPDYILEGNDGGINISHNAGLTWTKVADLPVTQFYEIGLDKNNPQRLYGGTQDNGTLRTLNGGLNDWTSIYGGDGFYVIVDHTDPNIIYAESQYGYLGKSTNGGYSFNIVLSGIDQTEPTNWSTPVIMDDNNHNVLYYGTDRIYRSTTGAVTWSPISPDLTDGIPGTRLGTVTTIAAASTNSNVIWAGTDDSHVWVSKDWGYTWNDVSSSLPYRWVTRIVPDPISDQVAYVTFSGLKWKDPQPHVFRTTNQGQTWTDISSNLPDAPINAMAVDPLATNYLFVGTDLGAYFSSDTGMTWKYLSSELPMVPVYDMKIHPIDRYLAIGTHARSMYKLDLSGFTGIDPRVKPAISETFILKQNYPNPFNPVTTIPYTLAEKGLVHLSIYNTLGQQIKTLVNTEQSAGNYQISWDGRDRSGQQVASGIYLYTLQVGEQKQTRRLTFLK